MAPVVLVSGSVLASSMWRLILKSLIGLVAYSRHSTRDSDIKMSSWVPFGHVRGV